MKELTYLDIVDFLDRLPDELKQVGTKLVHDRAELIAEVNDLSEELEMYKED